MQVERIERVQKALPAQPIDDMEAQESGDAAEAISAEEPDLHRSLKAVLSLLRSQLERNHSLLYNLRDGFLSVGYLDETPAQALEQLERELENQLSRQRRLLDQVRRFLS
jgi:hypothetical protein